MYFRELISINYESLYFRIKVGFTSNGCVKEEYATFQKIGIHLLMVTMEKTINVKLKCLALKVFQVKSVGMENRRTVQQK